MSRKPEEKSDLPSAIADCVWFLDQLARSLEGDDAAPDQELLVEQTYVQLKIQLQALAANRTRASDAKLEELRVLKKKVEHKNRVLESLRDGLKDFELEVALRSEEVDPRKKLKLSE